MKFSVKYIGKSGRLGSIKGMGKHQGQTFETPLLTMYTRGGNVPHITHEVLQMVSTDNLIMNMPLTTIMTASSSIEKFSGGISEFVGLKEYPSYITPQDPAIETPSGYNVGKKVAVWTKYGKREIDAERYMHLIEIMKPDIFLGLCDGDTNADSSKKRIIKSTTRTLNLFKACFNIRHESPVLQSIALLAPLEGGYDLHARKTFTEEISKYDVCGYVLDGLHTNGPDAECVKFDAIDPVVKVCLERLPEQTLRVAHGAWSPSTLLGLVAAGFDMFDTSLPYLSTERGAALIFPFNLDGDVEKQGPTALHCAGLDPKHQGASYEFCLEDERYREDFQPLLKNCGCLTCQHHTRAYIHHLLKCQELLGRVLIMIHNLHHFLEFFKSIRRAIQNDSLGLLETLVTTGLVHDSDQR